MLDQLVGWLPWLAWVLGQVAAVTFLLRRITRDLAGMANDLRTIRGRVPSVSKRKAPRSRFPRPTSRRLPP